MALRWDALLIVAAVILSSARAAAIDQIRVNCGGKGIEDIGFLEDEPKFYADTKAPTFVFNDTSGNIADTPWGSVYLQHRYADDSKPLTYKFPVPQGKFMVGLMFIENYAGAAKTGGRVFDIFINDALLDSNVDIWSRVGLNEPLYITKTGIRPKNGYIVIRLAPIVQNAAIAGIVIEGRNVAEILWESGSKVPEREIPTAIGVETPPPKLITATDGDETPMLEPVIPADTGVQASTSEPTKPNDAAPASTDSIPQLVGSGKWRSVPYTKGTPVPRHEACAVMVGGKLYNLGGRGNKVVSVFDPVTRVWTTMPGPNVEINHVQCVAYKSSIYLGPAFYGPYPFEKSYGVTWVFDTIQGTWSKMRGLPKNRQRGGGAFALYKDKMYAAAGAQGGHGAHATTTGLFDVYDPKNDSWEALPDMPFPRDHTNGAIVNGKLCVAGGRDGGQDDFWNKNIAETVCYNFATGKWEVKALLPTPRGGAMVGATCHGWLMVAGGEGKTEEQQNGQAYNRVDFFNESANKYMDPSYMTNARHGSGLAMASCNSCATVYCPSGSGGMGGGPELSTTDVWSPDGVERNCA